MDRDGAFDDFDEDTTEAAGGFELADWGWGAISLTLTGIGSFGPGDCPLALLAGAGVGGCFCGSLSAPAVDATGELSISETPGVRRVGTGVWLFKASCSRLSLSMNCKCTESSEYTDCCAGDIG